MSRMLASFALGAILMAAILASVMAFAQDDIAALVRPLVVDVRQSVPIMADVVVPLDDGDTIIATVPLTLDIALQIGVSGVVSESVTVLEETEPEVTVATVTPASAVGSEVNYETMPEGDERLELLSAVPVENEDGNFSVEFTFEASDDVQTAGVTLICYGERDHSLCGTVQLLRRHPDGTWFAYVETDVPFEQVKWFEIGWEAN